MPDDATRLPRRAARPAPDALAHPFMDPGGSELYAPACFARRCPPMQVAVDGRRVRVYHGTAWRDFPLRAGDQFPLGRHVALIEDWLDAIH